MDKEALNTRENIIKIATRLFMDNGYQGTSTRQIARLAKVTQPNLYHHFKNKEAVYIGVIEVLLSDVNAELVQIVSDYQLNTMAKLQKFALCLKENHPFDFDLMVHDFKTSLTEQTQRLLFGLWNDSYKKPLLQLFQESDFILRSGVTAEVATTHFLNTLAPYIKANQTVSALSIEQMVDFFVNGIAGEK
ncbi:TetR/AcrR family transcriptional regulator [Enterococcus sp. UD-01]|jgi:AcrR family transcriptional regulator|uniref:TetR/AcrR family transcriptional regulator n=1 Tax=Enterococcus sp. UD-01 TaxID=3373911 RepID=UPI003834002C